MKSLSKAASRTSLLTAVLTVGAVIAAAIVFEFKDAEQVSAAPLHTTRSSSPPVAYDEDGQLKQPKGYRKWIYVGTPLTPNDMNGGKAAFPEFHSVYINPAAFAHYEQTGKFPDGTVVVKELTSVGTKRATSGKGYFMGDFIGLEVAVKDQSRFQDEPGNWAYFSFGHELPLKDLAKPQPVANCSACHGASADDDYVFAQYYPVLRAAKESERPK